MNASIDSTIKDHCPHTGEVTKQYITTQRQPSEQDIRLGKKLNIMKKNPQIQNILRLKGMSKVNLIAEWENIVSPIYASYSYPNYIRNISGVKTLFCDVLYTRAMEIKHEKNNFIKKINLYAGINLIDDIRFKQTDKLPKRPHKPKPIIKPSPKEIHPYLKDKNILCKSPQINHTLNQLAHLISPLNQDKVKESTTTPKKTILNAWRERAKIILNSQHK